ARERLKLGLLRLFFAVYRLPEGRGLRASLAHSGRLADRARVLLVFPEGERTRDGRLLPFRPGAFLMAPPLRPTLVPRRPSRVWAAGGRGGGGGRAGGRSGSSPPPRPSSRGSSRRRRPCGSGSSTGMSRTPTRISSSSPKLSSDDSPRFMVPRGSPAGTTPPS